jgi:uncharacterized protein
MTFNNRVACLCFSGGVDSAVLAVIAHQELKDKMCAVTAVSPSLPSRDRLTAVSLCREMKIPHALIETDEFENAGYTSNPEDRCFHCKRALYTALERLAGEKGLKYIVEGTNASDLEGHRPGHLASAQRKDVATPLIDAAMTKGDVRRLARELSLSVADKPSSACLSSRVPQGERLSADLLKRIDEAEEFIRSCGMTQVRVRHHGDVARIEIAPAEFTLCLENRDRISAALKEQGYKFVTLDVTGYRTGGTAG